MRPAYYFTGLGGYTPLNFWIHYYDSRSFFDSDKDEAAHKELIRVSLYSKFEIHGHGFIVEDYLNERFAIYSKSLPYNEDIAPFFEFLIDVIQNPPPGRDLSRDIYKAIWSWINSHPDYSPSSLDRSVQASYDKPNTLSSRQIAIIIYYGELKVKGAEAAKLIKNSVDANRKKVDEHHSYFLRRTHNNVTPHELEKTAQTNLLNDFIAARNYLTGKARIKVEKEVKKVWPECPFE